MPLETFKASKSLTLGVELELQLVNTYDMDLSSSANDLLELLRRKPFPGVVTPEMTQSMIEIATDVPGFAADEPVAELGQSLKLPAFLEKRRAEIEALLPALS